MTVEWHLPAQSMSHFLVWVAGPWHWAAWRDTGESQTRLLFLIPFPLPQAPEHLDHEDQEDLELKLLRLSTSLIRKEEHFLSGMFHTLLEGVETKVRQSGLTLIGLRDLEARRKLEKLSKSMVIHYLPKITQVEENQLDQLEAKTNQLRLRLSKTVEVWWRLLIPPRKQGSFVRRVSRVKFLIKSNQVIRIMVIIIRVNLNFGNMVQHFLLHNIERQLEKLPEEVRRSLRREGSQLVNYHLRMVV